MTHLLPAAVAKALAVVFAAQPGDRPELTTLPGKAVFARPDADGAIAKADAAPAADPKNVDLVLAAACARDVALQCHSAIEVCK